MIDPEEYLRLDKQLCFALYASTRLVLDAYEPILEDLGLAYEEYLVMLLLWERDGMPERRIAERLRTPPEQVAPWLDGLAAKGLLERDAKGGVADVWLTRAGHDLRKRALAVPEAFRCRVQLPEDDITAMREMLHRMIDRVADAAAERAA